MSASERAYLDWNASAPMRPEVAEAMAEGARLCGNPSSVHAEGRAAKNALEAARADVADFMGADPSEIIFTSGGTEANNLAVALLRHIAKSEAYACHGSAHPSLLNPARALAGKGWEGKSLGIDGEGLLSAPEVAAGFALVEGANHETGALQDLGDFALKASRSNTPWHCDAIQLWGKHPLNAHRSRAFTVSLSAHKFGGPKGAGALYVKDGIAAPALMGGGPQEKELRPGTENLMGILGLARACRSAAADLEKDISWMRSLSERLLGGIRELAPEARLNGPADPSKRLPNTLNVSVPGVRGETLVRALDLEGVAVSHGSACTSGALEKSSVLKAMGVNEWRTESALRISLGYSTTPGDVDTCLGALKKILERMNP